MARNKARLLEQVAALDRDMAELTRLSAKYNLVVLEAEKTPVEFAASPEVMSDLIRLYRTVENSRYHKLTHSSRKHYDALLSLVEGDHGPKKLSDLNVDGLERWHQAWSEGGKQAIAFAKIQMVRALFGFGTEVLKDGECGRLFGILCKLKFRPPKARTERLSIDQANAIRAKARELGRPSIALAQALQWDFDLLQKDVIGEWVPLSDKAVSEITHEDMKWVRGLRWHEIDDNFILRHESASWQGDIEVDLRKAPMVLEELRIRFGFDVNRSDHDALPSSGPLILSEHDNLPWDAPEFRRWWRQIADACGIPKNVRNSDSRARAKEGSQWPDHEAGGRVAK